MNQWWIFKSFCGTVHLVKHWPAGQWPVNNAGGPVIFQVTGPDWLVAFQQLQKSKRKRKTKLFHFYETPYLPLSI